MLAGYTLYALLRGDDGHISQRYFADSFFLMLIVAALNLHTPPSPIDAHVSRDDVSGRRRWRDDSSVRPPTGAIEDGFRAAP